MGDKIQIAFSLNLQRTDQIKLILSVEPDEVSKLYTLAWKRHEKAQKELNKLMHIISDSFMEKADVETIFGKLIKALDAYNASLSALQNGIACLEASIGEEK